MTDIYECPVHPAPRGRSRPRYPNLNLLLQRMIWTRGIEIVSKITIRRVKDGEVVDHQIKGVNRSSFPHGIYGDGFSWNLDEGAGATAVKTILHDRASQRVIIVLFGRGEVVTPSQLYAGDTNWKALPKFS